MRGSAETRRKRKKRRQQLCRRFAVPLIRPALFASRQIIHQELIRYQGDELPVRGLFLFAVNGIAEDSVDVLDLSARPGHLDGVADCPLHFAGGGIEKPGHARIKLFGDGVDDRPVGVDLFYRLPEEVIALDVGWDAHGQENVCDTLIQDLTGGFFREAAGAAFRRRRRGRGLNDAAHEGIHAEGLDEV
jgi:hypothetical protein